jgi:uncharacterized protein with FMN-binding domain
MAGKPSGRGPAGIPYPFPPQEVRVRRRTTVAVVGSIAGSALLIGTRFAVPSLADAKLPGHHAKTAFQPGPGCGSDDHGRPTEASPNPRREGDDREDDGREDDGRKGSDDHGVTKPRTTLGDRCHMRSRPPSPRPPSPSATVTTRPPLPSPSTTSPAPQPTIPSPSATCTMAIGNAVNVASPGIGALTVTIQVCGGVLKTSTGTLSQSNLPDNSKAIPALNPLAVQYYKTNLSMIHYSGATLTSNAYQASLRSAMTKAGI